MVSDCAAAPAPVVAPAAGLESAAQPDRTRDESATATAPRSTEERIVLVSIGSPYSLLSREFVSNPVGAPFRVDLIRPLVPPPGVAACRGSRRRTARPRG